MQEHSINLRSLHHLPHLSAFAWYLRNNRLEEYVQVLLQFSRELKVPLLNMLGHLSDEEIRSFVQQSASELLYHLEKNEAETYISRSIEKWSQNQLPFIDAQQVVAEDITLVSYVRKQALLSFVEDYCATAGQMLPLIRELDFFTARSEEIAFKTYTNLLRTKVEEQSYLTQKITNTAPGIIYLLNLDPLKVLFANQTAEEFFGFTAAEFATMGRGLFEQLIHPDHLHSLLQFLKDIRSAKEGEVRVLEFRMKTKEGSLLWMRNYSGVFKRHADGRPAEIIGNIMNIDSEKAYANQLQESEKRYRQAERLTHIGNYEWDLKTNTIIWSEELYRIYGLQPKYGYVTYEEVASYMTPDENANAQQEVDKALETKRHFDFYYNIRTPQNEVKILHARGDMLPGPDNKIEKIIGTVQDVTEKQTLIRKLRHSEQMYQQAEEMALIGNWNWMPATGALQWTDQLYRIYGLEPQAEEMTLERFLSFVHPEDRPAIEQEVSGGFQDDRQDFTFRIVTAQGTEKILRSIAHVQRGVDGKISTVFGTEQDITEQQNLLRKLERNEKLFKQAEAIAHIGNWWYNLQTGQVYWSDEMYNIYEMPPGEKVTYELVMALVHPDDRESVAQSLNHSIETKQPYDRVHRVVLGSGKIKTVHRRAEVVTDPSANTLLLLGTTQDVTEQYRIQQELKENQNFIRKIADATPSVITSYNIHTGQYLFVSEGIRKLLGYDPQEVLSRGIAFANDIIHPDDVSDLMQKNSQALEEANRDPEKKDIVVEFTYRMRHRNGHYRWFHTYGTIFDRNSSGQVEHVLNISLDVTEQREASRKIEEQEQFIQNIADASPTILYVYDVPTKSFAYINREIYFVLGYTPEEVVTMGSSATGHLYHPDDFHLLPERPQSDRRIVDSDVMIQYECRIKARSNEWQWFLVREVVFRTSGEGLPVQIVGAALDITKRKEMEKTLLQNSFMLEQSNASLEEFAYVASHDLKEPLRKISTFGDRLMATQADKLAADGKVYLNKIIDASQRMQTMISDLLSISMISGNKAFEPYSLQKVLEETLQTLEFKIEQKNALIESDGLPEANIVASQFRQLFQNLLSNSLKFLRPDVQPKISITHQYLQPEEVHVYQPGTADRYLKIEFSDNGIGFENEFAGKIFLIFQRLHGRSEYEGSGIGLAICKKIVEHHGGVIYASGELGKGATFTIILPA